MQEEDRTQAFLHSLLEHNVLIGWKPQYELGVPVIDEHHRGIVTAINSLHFGIEHEQGREMLGPVIRIVNIYTQIHFETEEIFFRICDFPHLEEHHEMHNEFRRMLSRISEKCLENENPLEFLDFLQKWFINHICDKDRLFKEYLLDINR